jgi:tripartite-type tricarboxylate transporter receptor subunit TctC
MRTSPFARLRAHANLPALTGAIILLAGPALAQDKVADFYKDKTVNIIVGTSPGGGYDTYARLISRHMGKHVPGNPKFLVQNMPGAGSHRAAGYIAKVAPKDGTYIGAMFSAQPLGRLLMPKGKLGYDVRKLKYIGSASTDTYNCFVRKDAPAKTFKETFEKQIVVGGTSPRGSSGLMPILHQNMLGTKLKLVVGYKGSRQIFAAIEKGELHGMCGMNWTSIHSRYKRFITDNIAHVLVQESFVGDPDANKRGIPKTTDFVKNKEYLQFMKIIYSQGQFARPYMVSGEVPAERVAALRKAFLDTLKDKDLLAEAAKLQFKVDPLSGKDFQKMVDDINAMPEETIARFKKATEFRKGKGAK